MSYLGGHIFAFRDPRQHLALLNVRDVDLDEIRDDLERLRAVDPDTHARLTETIVLPEREEPPMQQLVREAEFESKCAWCGDTIDVGEEIVLGEDGDWIHVDCEGESDR